MKHLKQPSILSASLKSGERGGHSLLLIMVIVLIVGAVTAGGLSVYSLLREEVPPSEQTSKFLPADTQIYFSLNLRPGNDQLRKFRDILARFRQHPNFQSKLDELLDNAKVETGVDLEEDVLPWLGPELAIAFVDVVGSAVGAATGGAPLVVAMLGTSDPVQALSVLQDWTRYLAQEEGLKFATETYEGFTVFSEQDDDQHYVVMEDYVLFATDRELLEDTIDRVRDDNTTGSLYASPRFQRARDALPDPRFSTMYLDSGAVWKDARLQLGDTLPAQVRRQFNDLIPEWVTVSGSLLDMGTKLVVSYAAPKEALETPIPANSQASARLLPPDALAYVSFAVEPSLDELRKQLGDQKISELGPDPYETEAVASELGIDIDEESTLGHVLDQLLDRFKEALGLDLEQDFLSWMTGEFSLALLPTDFRGLTTDPPSEALEAAAFVQFDAGDRDRVAAVMGDVVKLLEDGLGLQGDQVSYDGGAGVVFDLRELTGSAVYRPGYLILGDHLIISTNADTLELVASINQGQRDSLATGPEYSRVLGEVTGTGNSLVYVNIGEITKRAVAAIDPVDRSEYQESVDPFVGPLSSLLMTVDTQDDVSRFYIVLSIE